MITRAAILGQCATRHIEHTITTATDGDPTAHGDRSTAKIILPDTRATLADPQFTVDVESGTGDLGEVTRAAIADDEVTATRLIDRAAGEAEHADAAT